MPFFKKFINKINMPQPAPLPAARLHATYDANRLPFKDSREITIDQLSKDSESHFQPRVMHALDLALQIKAEGYHVYLSGEVNLGRAYMLLSYLKPKAKTMPSPPDLLYVRNFSDPDAPRLIEVAPGQGKIIREKIKNFIENIGSRLEKMLDAHDFARQRADLIGQFHDTRKDLLCKMNDIASNKGFKIDLDDNSGITLSPLEESSSAVKNDKQNLKQRGNNLAKTLTGFIHKLNKAEESFHEMERELEREAMAQTLQSIFDPLQEEILTVNPSLGEYFTELRTDIINNTSAFLAREQNVDESGNFLTRYNINLFVDNSQLVGAPIIVEDNPTVANLLGCVERESEMGALVTDLTLIRSGSLHRANGGFLIIHVEDLLEHLLAWEGLLRALKSTRVRIEDSQEDMPNRAKALHPQPMQLDLKVVLIGSEDFYEDLLFTDERFGRIFRIKAHMTEETERNETNIKFYLQHLAKIINEASLPPFTADALACLIDQGSHLCEDQRKLSLKFPLLRELMIEAAAISRMQNLAMVNAAILEEAYAKKNYRVNLLEELFMEDYDRDMVKLTTNGKAIGQVNGLSITTNGDFEFGLPHRISCTVGVGHEGVIDLEREAELAGPIHTKAMMILKSYLTNLFARKKPIVLSASLYFEQSYVGIEGDSASGAELAALLSALADVPARLDLAFTGAVSCLGEIMAVGGVTRKIEGFYKVCARHGLTGSQGVIIPTANIDHLMLSPEILASVEKGEFAIYAVDNIEDALLLLTGIPAGKKRKNGGFTPNSLYDLVDKRLEELGSYGEHAFKGKERD